ncbi:MAG TPA: YciI family protein [Nocardioidaceae bacterium]|nr:YciI family protein [Nocardioidaceae bacterium]
MRFMIMVKMREDAGAPPPALIDAMGQQMAELFQSGVMVDAGGLCESSASTEVRVHDGELSVTDGPFTEAKELVGGYSIVEVHSREEAVELGRRVMHLHKTYWPGWEGAAEVRQIAGSDEGPSSA